MKTFLFIGCGSGIEDPNFGPLVEWLTRVYSGNGRIDYLLCREKELPAYSKFRKIAFGSEYHDLPSFVEILASLAQQFPDLANDIGDYDRLSDDTTMEPTERERTQDALAEKIAAAIVDQPLTLSQLLDYPSPGLLAGLSLAIGRKGSPDDLYVLLGVADQALSHGSKFHKCET